MSLAYMPLNWFGNEDGTERLIDGESTGWLVSTDISLSRQMMARIKEYGLRVQKERLKSMPIGPMRDALTAAVVLLEAGRIRQNLTRDTGDKVLWDAWNKSQSTKFISAP